MSLLNEIEWEKEKQKIEENKPDKKYWWLWALFLGFIFLVIMYLAFR